mmetsp:Transcript_51742/g.85133  ORF Transcript_51742/g.85133 Transcript_51742/m.85133 type:complete len:80 (+) Transcript_51742:500-739(+)
MYSILFIEFMELPEFGIHNFALIVTHALTKFCWTSSLTKENDREGMLKESMECWVQTYGWHKKLQSEDAVGGAAHSPPP